MVAYIFQVLGLLGVKWFRHFDGSLVISNAIKISQKEERLSVLYSQEGAERVLCPAHNFSAGGEEYCRPKAASAHGTLCRHLRWKIPVLTLYFSPLRVTSRKLILGGNYLVRSSKAMV